MSNVSLTYRYVPNKSSPEQDFYVSLTYPRHVSCMALTCLFHVPYMSLKFPPCSKHVPDNVCKMFLICHLHVFKMSLLCPNYVPIISLLCPKQISTMSQAYIYYVLSLSHTFPLHTCSLQDPNISLHVHLIHDAHRNPLILLHTF